MSILAQIGKAFRAMCRWIGLGQAPMPRTAELPTFEASRTIAVPAVAGFAMRAPVDRFLLAARLASVARLNPPAGRKPWRAARPVADHAPIPAARLGAKRTRLDGNRGPRVLRPAVAAKAASNVIQFPAKAIVDRRQAQFDQAA